MKVLRRVALALLVLVVIGGGLWLYGRAPAEDVLRRECARLQAERRREEAVLRRRVERVEGAEHARLRERYDALARETKTVRIRGWEVVLIPPGARPPPAEGYFDAGEVNVTRRGDPPVLGGAMRVWYRPMGFVAGLLSRLGLAGAPRLELSRG